MLCESLVVGGKYDLYVHCTFFCTGNIVLTKGRNTCVGHMDSVWCVSDYEWHKPKGLPMMRAVFCIGYCMPIVPFFFNTMEAQLGKRRLYFPRKETA